MSQTLHLPNFSGLNIVDKTTLTADTPASSTSLTVDNADNFNTGYVLIGSAGSKNAELLPAQNTTSGTTITLTSPTILIHDEYEAVYSIYGNDLRVYRAADGGQGEQPADGSFGLIDTVAIDPNGATTEYTDSSGGGTYWYKYTFYNSGSANETDLGSATAVRGNFTVNYCSVDDIRDEAGFKYAVYVDDSKINRYRQQAQNEINGALDEFYVTPIQPPIPDFLNRITIRLAAGYLRLSQYSQIADPKVNGQGMVDDAQKDIDKLIKKERVLTDGEGRTLDQPGATGGIDGWPNQSTWTTPGYEGGSRRLFRISDVQGQPLTNDPSGNPQGNLYYGRRY